VKKHVLLLSLGYIGMVSIVTFYFSFDNESVEKVCFAYSLLHLLLFDSKILGDATRRVLVFIPLQRA
jgi:hypothetical protein